ncbi:MAG: cytochrome c3 family protein [Actinomycetes bacterium]
MDDFRAINFNGLLDQLLTLLRDPTSNLQAALILYGMIGVLVLIVLIAGIVLLMGMPDDEYEDEDEEGAYDQAGQEGSKPPHDASTVAPGAVSAEVDAIARPPKTARSTLIAISVTTALFLAVWILAGYTTSTDAVCSACHLETVHDQAKKGEDPHESSPCVTCHEPGGPIGRYVGGFPTRMLHFVEGVTGLSAQASYGRVATSACSACHSKDISGVSVNQESGVRMSHAEPLAASASCLDCHKPIAGVVARQTVGMGSCVRCHDAKTAASECSTCHDKKTAAAARAKTTSFAKPQVQDIKCGGCHDEKTECDTCHGARMPHSVAFKMSAHARAGAVDFWYNGGKGCARCHTATRRPCTKCHSPILGKGHPAAQAQIHQTATAARDRCQCHDSMAISTQRDFCQVCHSQAAIDESPR